MTLQSVPFGFPLSLSLSRALCICLVPDLPRAVMFLRRPYRNRNQNRNESSVENTCAPTQKRDPSTQGREGAEGFISALVDSIRYNSIRLNREKIIFFLLSSSTIRHPIRLGRPFFFTPFHILTRRPSCRWVTGSHTYWRIRSGTSVTSGWGPGCRGRRWRPSSEHS